MVSPLLRAEGQASQIYLAFSKPSVVFSALVNETFSSWDDVHEVTWDGLISGSHNNILPEMTLLVGSAPGLWDLGVGRIRKAASATKLYIGRQSDIRFADNMYLTVIDDFRPAARHWRVVNSSTIYMDEDIGYSDQNLYSNPFVRMGQDAAVWLKGASVTHQRHSGCWSADGSSITDLLWSATGPASVTIDDETSTDPVFTFTQVGEYIITLVATTAHNKTNTSHRRTFVFGPGYLPVKAELDSISDGEGVEFQVTIRDRSVLNGTYDMPRVTLFAQDYYGDSNQSFGPVEGLENVIAFGWGSENVITRAPGSSETTLTVQGPPQMMDAIDILAAGGLKKGSGTWLLCSSPKVDMVMYNLLYWRSNLATLIDVFPSGDTRVAKGLIANNGSLWEQVKDIASRIFVTPRCDRYGRLSLNIDAQMIPYASRDGISVIMDITKADWRDHVVINRRVKSPCSQVYLGATDDADPYFSKAPGKVVSKWGRPLTKTNVLVSGQSQTNQLAGDFFAWQSNPFPDVTIPLRGNNRLIDIAPNQYVTLSLAEEDTPLGIVWNAKRLIPRRVTYTRNNQTGEFLADLECEAETIGYDGVTYIPPEVPDTPTPPHPTPNPPYTPPGPITTTAKRFNYSLLITSPTAGSFIGSVEVPFYCNLDSVKIVTKPGESGSIEFDIRKCSYAAIETDVHPVEADSIIGVGGTKPNLTDQYKSIAVLTGWTTYWNVGDWLFFYVITVSGLTEVTLSLSGYAYQ